MSADEGQRRKAALTQLTIIRKCIREVIGYWGHPKYRRRRRMQVFPAAQWRLYLYISAKYCLITLFGSHFFILHTHTHTHTNARICTRNHSHTNKTFYFFLDQQAESSHSAWTYAYGLIKVIIQLVDHSRQGIIRNNSSSCLAHF